MGKDTTFTNEIKAGDTRLIFIGLLTHQQKQASFFVSQDEDFIYLFHRDDGDPRIVGIFDYETATIKEIRETARWLSGEART